MSIWPEWVLAVIVLALTLAGRVAWIKRLVREEVERAWERKIAPAHAAVQLQKDEVPADTGEQEKPGDGETEAEVSSEAEPEGPPPDDPTPVSPLDAKGFPTWKKPALAYPNMFWKSDREDRSVYPKLWQALKSAQTQIWGLYEPHSERSGEIDLTLPGKWKGITGIPVRSVREGDGPTDDEEPFEKLRRTIWRLRRSMAFSQWRRAKDLLTAHELDCSEEVFHEASQVVRDLRRVLAMARGDADAPGPRLLRNEVYGKLQALKRRLQTELGRPLDDGPEPDDFFTHWWNPRR